MSKGGRLRVLHAAPYLWSGAGSVITRLVESQIEQHRVALVTSPKSGELCNWPAYERRLATSGIRHDRIDLFHREGEAFWPAVAAMTDVIDGVKPDIIHTHAGTPTAVAVLARRSSSRPATPLVSHFYSWGLGRPAWMNGMDLWAFGRADMVVCSAHAYRDILLRGGIARRRLRLIPWGIEITQRPVQKDRPYGGIREDRPYGGIREDRPYGGIREDRPYGGIQEDGPYGAPVIGTIGRIERRKGQLDLVQAFARLRVRWPGARLEIVGPVAEEPYAAEIQTTIERLELGDAVLLTGLVPDPAVYLKRWSAYVSLSSDEGQGLAVLEAMASGVPVVALRVAGVEDYLTSQRTGLIARTRSARDVAGQVDRLLAEPALATRLSAAALAMVRRRYSWERTVRDIDAIYRQLI